MKYITSIACLLCTACTSAGPFVTNISMGKEEITIEKYQVLHNGWLSVISTENCTAQTLKK